jgi:type I restriction-modification system DNA methylase subunit
MSNLFTSADPALDGYTRIYEGLTELREAFHRSGRLDDSNAKLDEVSKLFAAYLAYRLGEIPAFPDGSSPELMQELQSAFAATTKLGRYQVDGGASIFGGHPALALRAGDEQLAGNLVRLVRDCVDLAFALRAEARPFDVLNEAFGHFVRDNFRSNIEDAQYMTPPEVVDFMVDMVLHDLEAEEPDTSQDGKHWIVLDPTCGVGSFLTAVYNRARYSDWLSPSRLRLFGQDKVERMVRLSTINLELSNVERHRITLGNSLETGSPIDELDGNVDIILTNPPFGARFDREHVARHCGNNTPFFSSLRRATGTISSELLFVDRNLRLLREGGRLLIVVPDSVVSSKGMAALLRHHVSGAADLRAVIELPATTFAQAGTRTKTAILYLQKGRSASPHPVFMGVATDLGFQVSSRKGVQIKVACGENQLPSMLAAYEESRDAVPTTSVCVVSAEPSGVTVPTQTELKGSWTPGHYSAARFTGVSAIQVNRELSLVRLSELVDFCSDERKSANWGEGDAFVSVLHILGEGFVDAAGAMSYAPKTPGVPVHPGEILMSRINPRIPRVCVAPDFGTRTLCSSEFEIMRPRSGMEAYTLAYLLQTDAVQCQIRSLTSGTSASHNRIRTSELGEVMIPIPRSGSKASATLDELAVQYRMTLKALAENAITLAKIRARERSLLNA